MGQLGDHDDTRSQAEDKAEAILERLVHGFLLGVIGLEDLGCGFDSRRCDGGHGFSGIGRHGCGGFDSLSHIGHEVADSGAGDGASLRQTAGLPGVGDGTHADDDSDLAVVVCQKLLGGLESGHGETPVGLVG